MDDSENKIEHNDGEFYDDDGDRYISVEQSIIGSCKEIKEMIAGRMPERSAEDFLAEMDQWVAKELMRENANSDNSAFRGRC